MSGLNDLDPASPDGKDLLSGGDNAIRLIISKLIEFAAVEHAMTGEHTFGSGSIAQRPAAGFSGRLYILIVAEVAAELQYDDGTDWVTLTSNQIVIGYASNLASHIAASVIPHADESVTASKIREGAILMRHLKEGTGAGTLEKLIDGSDANELHTHSGGAESGANGMIVYDTAGAHTLVVPAGVVRMYFTYIGGGGGGGGGLIDNDGIASAGGSAGSCIHGFPLATTPAEEIALYVGGGGNGATGYQTFGSDGEDTTVAGLLSAPGGNGGYWYQGPAPDYDIISAGGVPEQGMIPSGSGGAILFAGESNAWYPGGTGPRGGGGGASLFGPGGNGGVALSGGDSASSGTGAGGGGSGWATEASGNGGSGRIIVTW